MVALLRCDMETPPEAVLAPPPTEAEAEVSSGARFNTVVIDLLFDF